jgi:hypothetical protein
MKTKVTIDRANWRCGKDGPFKHGCGDTMLLNDSGYMCCLGFITKTAAPNVPILGTGVPNDLDEPVHDLSKLVRDEDGDIALEHTLLTNSAIDINDNEELTHAERELALLELFKHSAYSIEFVGAYAPPEAAGDKIR